MNYVFKAGLYAYALAMAVFGVQHFLYVRYAAGVAFILLGIMIFFFRNFNRNSTNYKQARVSAYITDIFKEASPGDCAFILAGSKHGRV